LQEEARGFNKVRLHKKSSRFMQGAQAGVVCNFAQQRAKISDNFKSLLHMYWLISVSFRSPCRKNYQQWQKNCTLKIKIC
jgi:ABC-type uncharacterized transport system permease subunit